MPPPPSWLMNSSSPWKKWVAAALSCCTNTWSCESGQKAIVDAPGMIDREPPATVYWAMTMLQSAWMLAVPSAAKVMV